ncbi:MAG: hypothetical protein PHH62_00505 [Endomicrobiaceae bacterium]|nr:hypothetical protein [Endomicrobiaceae bacterium]
MSRYTDWNLSNIKRAAEIQQNDEYIQDLYSNLKETILKRIKNSKKLSKYIEFDLTNDKLLRNINQPILKYNMLHQYIQLADISNKLNTKKITKEHNNFIIELQSRIPFDKYKEIINKSKKDNPYEYYLSLYSEFNEEYSYFIAKYANLYNFLEYSLEKEKINTVSLISQQNKYFKDYLKSLSTIQDQDKQDSIFVLKMTQLLGLFLKLTISEEEYTYFIENYERYINLLSKYLSEDYYTYEDLFDNDVIFDYHQINRDRNKIFLNNIKNLLSHKE